jgi:hypothetical protein
VAREILGTLPETGAISPQEFWEEYSSQFEPHLQRILRELAAHWDDAAKREDVRAEQLGLRV